MQVNVWCYFRQETKIKVKWLFLHKIIVKPRFASLYEEIIHKFELKLVDYLPCRSTNRGIPI